MEIAGSAMNQPREQTHLSDPAANSGERTYAMFNHLVGLVSIASSGVAVGGLIGAIIMWRIKCKESPFLDDHGRESVNFQISLLAYLIGGLVLASLFAVLTLGVGAILIAPASILGAVALVVLNLVGCIKGAIAANRGEYFRYPMCIRFIPDPDDGTT